MQQAIEKTLDVKVSVASDTADREVLLNMEDLIHKRMVNQTRAVGVVSDALRRARAGVRNQNRPIGTFLFSDQLAWVRPSCQKHLLMYILGARND